MIVFATRPRRQDLACGRERSEVFTYRSYLSGKYREAGRRDGGRVQSQPGQRTTPSRVSIMKTILTCVLSVSLATPLAAQRQEHERGGGGGSPPQATPVIEAAPLEGSIQVDGILDEPAWSAAEPFSRFIQSQPDEGEPASERTEVRVLVGSDALYIGAYLFDGDPDSIRARMARRDALTDFDYLLIQIDSRHDHLTAYAFGITPSGAFQDAARGADGRYDFSWDAVWDLEAQVTDEGWFAEVRIPFSQLRFASSADSEWGLQLSRMISRKRENSHFAYVPLTESSGVHTFGHLAGLGYIDEPSRLELMPYVVGRVEDRNTPSGNPFRDEREAFGSGGFDLKYGLTGQLTLDATVNPDFGQVEVDPAVVNLTAFETFYPEQRPFFVEGGGDLQVWCPE